MVFTTSAHLPLPSTDVLSHLFSSAPPSPHTPLIHSTTVPTESLSWHQTLTHTRRLIAGLQHHGLRPGDCVYHLAPNSIYYGVVMLGVMGAGGVVCNGSALLTKEETGDCVRRAGVRWIVCHPALGDKVETVEGVRLIWFDLGEEAAAAMEVMEMRREGGDDGDGKMTELVRLSALLEFGEGDWVAWDDEERSRGTVACRGFTSGSSGPSKVPQLSHYAMIAQAESAHHGLFDIPLSEPRRLLHPVGLSHLSGYCVIASVLKYTGQIYIHQMTSIPSLLDAFRTTRPTQAMLPASLAAALVAALAQTPADDAISSLRHISMPGMHTPAALRMSLAQFAPNLQSIASPFGLTEAGAVLTLGDHVEPGAAKKKEGTAGKLVPDFEILLRQPEAPGAEITAPGVVGEMCVKGPGLMMGYFVAGEDGEAKEMPRAEVFVVHDGKEFLPTGDLVYVDEDGFWYVVGRCKENFKVDYEHVNVNDLEDLLVQHPRVKEAAVLSMPVLKPKDVAEGTEVSPLIRAFVVLREVGDGVHDGPNNCGASQTQEEEIREWFESRVAKHKRLTGGLRIVQSLPRNSFGKLVRWKLDAST